jgi:hypothetical protein
LMKAPAISDSLDCFSLVWSGEGPGSDSVSSVVTHKMSGVRLREREYLTRTM